VHIEARKRRREEERIRGSVSCLLKSFTPIEKERRERRVLESIREY
jgi:hypothetical protein